MSARYLLPLTGFAHFGYLPARRMVGLSKLARVVERTPRWAARRLGVTSGTFPVGCKEQPVTCIPALAEEALR